jgi:uncharacterized protein YjbI with pentapeptide repeats
MQLTSFSRPMISSLPAKVSQTQFTASQEPPHPFGKDRDLAIGRNDPNLETSDETRQTIENEYGDDYFRLLDGGHHREPMLVRARGTDPETGKLVCIFPGADKDHLADYTHLSFSSGDPKKPYALVSTDLRYCNFQGVNFQDADLTRANLTGTDLRRADLKGTKLNWANLQEANLTGADLQGAYLRRANLQGAKLSWADLQGAKLNGANLQGAYLRRADLKGTKLNWANLTGADLTGTDLRRAALQWTYLNEAKLQGADLKGTNLQGADLKGADLKGTNLQGADLKGANVSDADFRNARNFNPQTAFRHGKGVYEKGHPPLGIENPEQYLDVRG